MPRVLVLGAGLMGPAIAGDLLKYGIADKVIITDIDEKRLAEGLERVKKIAGAQAATRCETGTLDLHDRRSLVAAMREADAVAGAYPVAAVREVTEAAVEAGTHLCDLTGSAEGFDVFVYDEPARRAGVTLLPGCGVAPGLTNALGGQGASRLQPPLEGCLYVGGLPSKPLPPLEYRIVFSMETVIDEYVAPALIIREGKTAEAPALDGLEEITFPAPIGKCEAFYTYGLGTLARTGPELGFKELSEKTVRYPGHRDKVLFLRECGFFAQEPVTVDGVKVVPRRLTGAVLTPILQRGDEADVTVFKVVVTGRQDGKAAGWSFEMVDHYDPKTGVTSMARTTGYTCSIIIGLLLRGRIAARGVAPLEKVFADGSLYAELRDEMAKRDMIIRESRI